MAQIQSGASTDILTVDTTSKAARSTLYDSTGISAVVLAGAEPANTSGVVVMGKNDSTMLPMRVDRLGNVGSMLHTPLFIDQFEGTVIHPLRWTITNTTMVATQASVAGLTINSGTITTITTGYMLKSSATFLRNQRGPLQAKFRARLNKVNNSVMELGFGDAATFNGANTTGAYWQVTASGAVVPVLTFKIGRAHV